MHPKPPGLSGGFIANPGADPAALRCMQSALGVALPRDYLDLLAQMNGGEGFVGSSYLRFYSAEQIVPLNRAYAAAEFAPGLVVFGSNGGGHLFGFDARCAPLRVVEMPFIPMVWGYARARGETLQEFLLGLSGEGDGADEGARPNPALVGKEIHEIHPIVFGGDPVDRSNKVFLTPEEYAPYVVWWNRQYRTIDAGRQGNQPPPGLSAADMQPGA